MARPEEADEGQHVVAHGVLVGRGVDADRERHRPGEQDGRERHDDGQEHAVADHGADRHVVLEGVAEVALEQAAQPDQVLLPPGPVEAVDPAQILDLLALDALALGLQLGHVGLEVVAGRQLDDHEGDQADREQRRHHDQQPMDDVAQHGWFPDPFLARSPGPILAPWPGSPAAAPRARRPAPESVPARPGNARARLCRQRAGGSARGGLGGHREQGVPAEHPGRPAGGLARDLGLEQAGEHAGGAGARTTAAARPGRCPCGGNGSAAGRGRSPGAAGSPRSTSAASRCRRAKWLACARTRRTGCLALAEQALEAALDRRDLPERHAVDQIVEAERGAVADHGGDVVEGDPARPGVGARDRRPGTAPACRARTGSRRDRRRGARAARRGRRARRAGRARPAPGRRRRRGH